MIPDTRSPGERRIQTERMAGKMEALEAESRFLGPGEELRALLVLPLPESGYRYRLEYDPPSPPTGVSACEGRGGCEDVRHPRLFRPDALPVSFTLTMKRSVRGKSGEPEGAGNPTRIWWNEEWEMIELEKREFFRMHRQRHDHARLKRIKESGKEGDQ